MNNTYKPGLYLQLFHGRKDPVEEMDDWGEKGPIFGPLQYVHGTYNSDLKFQYKQEFDYETEGWLYLVEDCVYYDGMYYGDWSAFMWDGTAVGDELAEFISRRKQFEKSLAEKPAVLYVYEDTLQDPPEDEFPV